MSSGSDHDENENENETGTNSNNKPTFRLSRYRSHPSTNSTNFKKSSTATTTTTTTKSTKTKNKGGSADNKSTRKHQQQSKNSNSSRTQISNNKSRTDGRRGNSSSSSSSSGGDSSNIFRIDGNSNSGARDDEQEERIERRGKERGVGGSSSSRGFLFDGDGDDASSGEGNRGRGRGRDPGRHRLENSNNNNNNKKLGRRRSRSEVLASIVGRTTLNNTNNNTTTSLAATTSRRRRSSSSSSKNVEDGGDNSSKKRLGSSVSVPPRTGTRTKTETESIERRRWDVAVVGGGMMNKRKRVMTSSSGEDEDEDEDEDDELRRLEQAFFDDDIDEKESSRLRNNRKISSSNTDVKSGSSSSSSSRNRTTINDAVPKSDDKRRRTTATLRLDDSSDESDDSDGELQQKNSSMTKTTTTTRTTTTTDPPPNPTFARNGHGSTTNDNDATSNEEQERREKSVVDSNGTNKTPGVPPEITRQDPDRHHSNNNNNKIDLLEREVDNLFIRSDQRTSTVKTFTKSLEANIGRKLNKDEKKKVKDRLVSLVNQAVVVPRPTISTSTTTTTTTTSNTVVSTNDNQSKTIDDKNKANDGTAEEAAATHHGRSKLTIDNTDLRTHSNVDATSKRTEDYSSTQTATAKQAKDPNNSTILTGRDGKNVDERWNSGTIGSTTDHTGSVHQSQSKGKTVRQCLSEDDTIIASDGPSTGLKSSDCENLVDENSSTRSGPGKSVPTSNSSDVIDKNTSAGNSSGRPPQDHSARINSEHQIAKTLPDPEVPTTEDGSPRNEESSVKSKSKRQPRKRKTSDSNNDTRLPTESNTETRAKQPKRQTKKKVRSKANDVEIIDVDENKTSEEVIAGSKGVSKANQTKKVSEKAVAVPRPRKRTRTKTCALCKTCPCQKTATGQDQAVPLDMSSTFSRSDAAVEKALIRRLQKLEKSVEHTAEQREMVRRNLKKHRRDIWKRKEKETSIDGRSGWSAGSIVPIGARAKVQAYTTSGVDEEAWFLPDAKIFEQQQTDSVKTHEGLVKKAQFIMYKNVPLKQPSLLQMGFSLEKLLDDDEPTDRTTGTAQDEKDNPDQPPVNSDGAAEIGNESLLNAISGWNECDENGSDEEEPFEETYVGDQEQDDSIMRTSWNGGDYSQQDGGEEVEGTDTTWIKSAMMHDSWPNTSTNENNQFALSFVTDFDKLFQDVDHHSFGTILDMNEEDEELVEESQTAGAELKLKSDTKAEGNENGHINLSLLSQGAQEAVQDMWSSVGKDDERVRRLQESAPEWKENIAFSFHQKDPAMIDEALGNIRKKRRRMEEMKKLLLDAWEREDTALEVFEDALEKSSARSRTKTIVR